MSILTMRLILIARLQPRAIARELRDFLLFTSLCQAQMNWRSTPSHKANQCFACAPKGCIARPALCNYTSAI
jgi:hypothetical protein